jgi:uncharacterized protein (DUF924 family)
MATTADDVHAFWFGEPATNEGELMAKVKRWFLGGPEMDADVQARFASTVEDALAGRLEAWVDTIRGRLSLVLVLDQFTRNVFRKDARTYAGDAKAQALALDAFDRGLEAELDLPERIFLSMPLLHSESLPLQQRGAVLARELAPSAPPLYAKFCGMHLEQTAKFTDVIARFGRFPHRNAILGRTSTPEEESFLADWAEKGPPAAARALR